MGQLAIQGGCYGSTRLWVWDGELDWEIPPWEGRRVGTQPPGRSWPVTLTLCSLLPPVPGPCDHEDLLDGVLFGAKYLGSTQLLSERNPPPSTRMAQAQEAVDRVKVRLDCTCCGRGFRESAWPAEPPPLPPVLLRRPMGRPSP